MLQVWSRRVLGLVLALGAWSLSPRAAAAQTAGRVAGVVTDQASGQPLENVQVFLQGTGYGTTTNASGRFFLLNVAPGTYTVIAKRLGYAQQERTNVAVQIDQTRELNFQLSVATAQLQRQVIRAEAAPLVPQGRTQSGIIMDAEQITNLPVTSIEGALSLQQGFTQVPNSTDLISYAESRRTATNPIRIRGGRGGETLMLIDGIPANNFIFGGPAFSLTPMAVQQLDFVKGGMDPQFGNALSGVMNIATKEGGSELAGSLRYMTNKAGDALGNASDAVRDYHLVEGFVSGPVPGTATKMSFMFAGREERQPDATLEFDQDIFVPSRMGTTTEAFPPGGPNFRDVFPGLRSFGFNNQRQAFGKLSYRFTPQMKLGFTFLDNENQRKPYDFQYFTTYGHVLQSPASQTPEDSAVFIGNLTGYRLNGLAFEKTVQSSLVANQQLFAGKFDHTMGRTQYNVIAGTFRTRRTTCNYFQGVCLGANFNDPNFTDDQFIGPLAGACLLETNPTCGTDVDFGGERLNTFVLRGDAQSQVTDHHNIQAGALYQRYDFTVKNTRNVGTNRVNVYSENYSNTPYDWATYLQDRIEYDFLTLKVGARFDYGAVPGKFFADPLDPTNGTTAADVCANPSDPRWASGRTFADFRPSGERFDSLYTPSATAAGGGCTVDETKVAAKIAAYDDFASAKSRKQFSPRIGLNFPLSERSAVFFNFGRYSQNPLLNNLLVNTGIGRRDATLNGALVEGTTRGPVLDVIGEGNAGYIGNANLSTERSTAYEMGYQSEFKENYALNLTLFNKNQTGLTGVRTGGQRRGRLGYEQVFDPGVTYLSSTPSYRILVNQDFQSVRGLEVQLRRRIAQYWGFDVNYSYSRARTNASDPEREFERQAIQGDPNQLTEVPADIDQPHVFNASLTGQVRNQAPAFRYGWLLRNTLGSITVRASSGLPYSPIADFFSNRSTSRLDRNSGRGPTISTIDAQVQKGFVVSNLRYEAFLQVRNLTDRRNCIQVFVTTGTCDAGAPDQNRSRQGNNVRPDAATSTYGNRADFFAPPRSVLGGLRVNF